MGAEIVILSEKWDAFPEAENVIKTTLKALRTKKFTLALSDDAHLQSLNKQFRAQDKPTNVLSFPQTAPRYMGDVVMAYETLAREAQALDIPFAHHLAHLTLHGALHLQGFDHETPVEAEIMEAKEVFLLAKLNIPNPYQGELDTLKEAQKR
jgi:probable rRNA maturation factor